LFDGLAGVLAVTWREILDRHQVQPADRLVALQQVLVGSGIATDMPDLVS